MSTNCIICVHRKRNGTDLLCDVCRAEKNHSERTGKPMRSDIVWPDAYNLCEHEWVSKPLGGCPADAESTERVTVCKFCGLEPEVQS